MRIRRILPSILLAIGFLALAAAYELNGDANWTLVQMPLPGPGRTVEVSFDVATSGEFWFEADVPRDSPRGVVENLPTVPCRLEVTITRGEARVWNDVIMYLRGGGQGELDEYFAEDTAPLKRGENVLRVRNAGDSQPFGDRGAQLVLTRYVHPTEYYLGGTLLRFIAWFFFAIGIAGAAISYAYTQRNLA